MAAAIRKALLVVLLPVAVFFATGYPMMHLTERDQFRRTGASESVPLNFRASGYDAADVIAYWQWLGPEGRRAERRFLAADFVFPLAYGGAMLASLLLAWAALRRPFSALWIAAPVAVTVGADWVENFVHWRQLQTFVAGGAVQPDWIRLASVATSVKSAFFYLSLCLILALAVWLVARASPRHARAKAAR